MRISKVHTGDKLKRNKTFGELETGDYFYWVISSDKTIKDITYKVVNKNIISYGCGTVMGYTEMSPNGNCVKRDVTIDWTKDEDPSEWDSIDLPSNSSFLVMENIIWATSLDLVYELIKKYKVRTNFK